MDLWKQKGWERRRRDELRKGLGQNMAVGEGGEVRRATYHGSRDENQGSEGQDFPGKAMGTRQDVGAVPQDLRKQLRFRQVSGSEMLKQIREGPGG